MLKFGIVGLNAGNGHPYSFSAVFNGYDPEALERYRQVFVDAGLDCSFK